MTCRHCLSAERLFDERRAAKDLRRYRRRGPDATTAALVRALSRDGVQGAAVLDIGCGVGAVLHELAARGAGPLIAVEASRAYLLAAVQEAERRGYAERLREVAGDFVEIAPDVPEADVVALDRVVCCYPDAEALIAASARKSRWVYGLVYPRDRIGARLFTALQNLWFRLRGTDFRLYIHPAAVIDGSARRQGFEPSSRTRTFIWEVVVFRRRAGEPPRSPHF